LGFGLWGLGYGGWAPIPNPQSPIPNNFYYFIQTQIKYFITLLDFDNLINPINF